MVQKVFLKFPPTLVLVHGWLFPEKQCEERKDVTQTSFCWGMALPKYREFTPAPSAPTPSNSTPDLPKLCLEDGRVGATLLGCIHLQTTVPHLQLDAT